MSARMAPIPAAVTAAAVGGARPIADSNPLRDVDVIIRTLANSERAAQLERAIDSVHRQVAVSPRLLVIVNGNRYDPQLLTRLQERTDLELHYLPTASAGAARMIGRRLVKAPYFLFLDDDDELLPHALAVALLPMAADPELAAVVTNGYYISGSGRQLFIPDLFAAQADPLVCLLHRAWMASCGALFNSACVGTDLFGPADLFHHEWTLIAFRISQSGMKIRFLDLPAYEIHDTPGSASKIVAHLEGELRALDLMRAYPVPRRVRWLIDRKYRNVLHVLANTYRERGSRSAAWLFHLRSLRPPCTLRYLLFTRKLLARA